jgi:hypothetical protein
VTGDREERNRVLGFPVERHPNTRPARAARKPRDPQKAAQSQRHTQAGEPQRVLGIPADWLDDLADEVLRPLLRRIRSWGRK